MERQDRQVQEIVGRLVQGTAVHAVAPRLYSARRQTRWSAAIALERIAPPALEALTVAAGDGDGAVRVPAVWAPEQICDPRGDDGCLRMPTPALPVTGNETAMAEFEAVFAAGGPDDRRGSGGSH